MHRKAKIGLMSMTLLVLLIGSSMFLPTPGVGTIQEVKFDMVDVVITFNQPVNFQEMVPQAIIKHQYQNILGVAASVPVPIYNILQDLPFVKSVELDYTYTILQDTLDWGVDQINAEVVWGGTENAADVVAGNYAGNGVKVAIIDTGIDYTHPDLNDNYFGGYDFVNNDNDPYDDNGHGTHVAGIVAAEDNGIGVIGVAPQADLYAVKVLNAQGSGTYSDIVAGIDWAISNNMDIISMSLGGSAGDTAMQDALQRAYDSGIVIVAASGNDYANSISYPARYSTVIAVGATDSSDVRASFSNYGPELEVVAPGVNIYSTYPGNTYQTLSGTSMATPMVTGVVALMLSKNPSLLPADVRQILHDSALDLGAAGWDQYYGYGRVQADVAISMTPSSGTPPDTTPPAQVTGLTVTTVSSTQLDLSWNAVSDPDLSYYNIYRDGVLIATTTATTYSDTGLTPSTTYTYEVSAVDTSGNEGQKSAPASGTTASGGGGGNTMYVFAIDMWYEKFRFWFWVWYDVYMKITVYDGNGNALAGVTVSVSLDTPEGTATGAADTGADGTVTLFYDNGPGGWYTCTVTDLTKTGYTYTPSNNVETSDSIYVS